MQARPLLSQAIEDGDFRELADPKMENIYNPQEMARMVSCAAAAIRHSARKRPKMSQVFTYQLLNHKPYNKMSPLSYT